ncbi:MAG TPA: hypothetical protein VGB50_07435 [Flavobacterium sp.]|jgi:hypothetical protein
MEEPHKEYSEDDSFDVEKTSAEYGNEPRKMGSDYTGNASFEEPGKGIESDTTTGSGYSEGERNAQDGTNNSYDHRGNDELVDKYNVNDKAHFDSSLDDFIPTVSNYKHSDGNEATDNPEKDSRH